MLPACPQYGLKIQSQFFAWKPAVIWALFNWYGYFHADFFMSTGNIGILVKLFIMAGENGYSTSETMPILLDLLLTITN